MNRFVPRELRAKVMRDLAEFVPANYYGELGEYDIETAILDHMLGKKLSYSAAYSGIPKRKRRASDLLVHFGYYRMSTFWVNLDRKSPSWLEFFGPRSKTAAGLEHFKNTVFGDPTSLVLMEEDFPRRVREYAAYLPADEKEEVLAFIETEKIETVSISSSIPGTNIKGIDKQRVITAFEGVYFDTDAQWSSALSDVPDWLKPCRLMKGKRGNKTTSSLWDPVSIAIALLDRNVPIKKLDSVFIRLAEWADEWREKSDLCRPSS